MTPPKREAPTKTGGLTSLDLLPVTAHGPLTGSSCGDAVWMNTLTLSISVLHVLMLQDNIIKVLQDKKAGW